MRRSVLRCHFPGSPLIQIGNGYQLGIIGGCDTLDMTLALYSCSNYAIIKLAFGVRIAHRAATFLDSRSSLTGSPSVVKSDGVDNNLALPNVK